MRTLLWVILFLFGVTGILIPITYLWTASDLPELDSEYDIEKLMKLTVENERMSVALGLPPKERGFVTWNKPDLSTYPKDFVALYLDQAGCPNYFKLPREDGLPWAVRVMKAAWGSPYSGNPGGACEMVFAMRIAQTLSIKGKLDMAVAANKIHSVLSKDQLVAYDMSSTYVSHGVMGVDQATEKTLHKPLKDMNLPELAEAALVTPPYYLFDEIRTCNNAALIKRARDSLLEQLAQDELVTPAQASQAEASPVLCIQTP